ncbi:MAG: Fpg/Nei family DNA glycosylase [Bacteroidota bacterium]
MPELPDVEIYKQAADRARGSKVSEITVKDEKFTDATKSSLNRHVKNHEIKKTLRRGKYLFIEMDNQYALVLHFGMTGTLNYLEQDAETPSYAKCIFKLSNKHKLVYVSKRKLGKVELTDDAGHYIEEQNLGPDALEISKKDFLSRIKKSKASVKSFLMNQSDLSGIGNVYSDEILFQACIHPRQKASDLSEKQQEELFKLMGKVLKTAIEKQADVSSMPGDFLLPKRKEGEKCPRGKGKVEKIRISGRTGYYCPDCQEKQ